MGPEGSLSAERLPVMCQWTRGLSREGKKGGRGVVGRRLLPMCRSAVPSAGLKSGKRESRGKLWHASVSAQTCDVWRTSQAVTVKQSKKGRNNSSKMAVGGTRARVGQDRAEA